MSLRRPRFRAAPRWRRLLLGCVLLPAPAAAVPDIAVSIPPLHSLVWAVMAGVGRPHLLLRSGRSPHSYQLRPTEAARIFRADLVIRIGEPLETFLAKPLSSLADGTRVMSVLDLPGVTLHRVRPAGPRGAPATPAPRDGVPPAGMREQARIDPHLWLDVDNAVRFARAAALRLARLDPARENRYRDNADGVAQRLAALDRRLAERLAPVREVPYATLHDGYQYLEHRYGLAGLGAAAGGHGHPPSAKRLHALGAVMREQRARCLFVEPRTESALATTLARDTGARVVEVDLLGATRSPGPDAYFATMSAIASAMADCLGGAGAATGSGSSPGR